MINHIPVPPYARRLPILIRFLPLIILVAVWLPLILHFHVPTGRVSDDTLGTARTVPETETLDEINSFFRSSFPNHRDMIRSAEKALQGVVSLPNETPFKVRLPFQAEDYNKGTPGRKLALAGLGIPELLCNAYEITGRDTFLLTARDVIAALADHESRTWFPTGLIWNDHAIAARIAVLTRFWKHYRRHPAFEPEIGKKVIQLADRSGRLLSKPGHFTYATNHGVMQNLALWQLCTAFPYLDGAAAYKTLAYERMKDQLAYYLTGDGVVLEHSAGYQRTGTEFMAVAFRLMTLLDIPIPEDWLRKYRNAKSFYRLIQRPDGTLPLYGDTSSTRGSLGPLAANPAPDGGVGPLRHQEAVAPPVSGRVFPTAGYAVWWNGLGNWPRTDGLAQTLIHWSYFPGHAHKHADEMSVLLWAGGQNWWTGSGYWPYGDPERAAAISWSGSNAPHLATEPFHSARNTTLQSHGFSENLAAVDLRRRGPENLSIRRQVVHLRPAALWMVIDNAHGAPGDDLVTTWSTGHDVRLTPGGESGAYRLRSGKTGLEMNVWFLGADHLKLTEFRGSTAPFAGWEGTRPAPAVRVRQPGHGSWSMAVWQLPDQAPEGLRLAAAPRVSMGETPGQWITRLPLISGDMALQRRENRITWGETGSTASPALLELGTPQADQADNTNRIRAAFQTAAKKYPAKKYNIHRHYRISTWILVLFIIQESFLPFFKKLSWKRLAILRRCNAIGWLFIGMWALSALP